MPKLVSLQILRALAALAIALIHIEGEVRARAGWPAPDLRPFPFEAGVDVFFVVSGFVIVFASGRLFGQAGAIRVFLARRIARIAPLYWLTTAIVLAAIAVRPDLMRSAVATPELVLASFLFVPLARPDGAVQPVYSLGWTLNYEMFFYLVFAGALLLPRRRAVAAVTAVLLLLVAIGRLLGPLPLPFGFWSDPIVLEFALGMWLGLARARGVVLPGWARGLLAAGGLCALALVGGDAVIRTGINSAWLFGLPAAAIVAAAGLGPGRHAAGSEPWPVRFGEALGDASYAIYLLHPFAVRGTARIVDAAGLGPALGPVGFAVPALVATVALALLSYRLVEKPATRLGRRMLEPAGPVRPPAAADNTT